jgi:ankyrin repeat protein
MIKLLQTKSIKKITDISEREIEMIKGEITLVVDKLKGFDSKEAKKKLALLKFSSVRNSILHLAVKFSHIQAAKDILQIADGEPQIINSRNINDFAPIHFPAITGNLEVANLLIEAGADINLKASDSKRGWAPIHYAARYNNLNIVELLMGLSVNKEATTSFGLTPLIVATEFGHLNIIDFLLRKGANKNIQTSVANDRMNLLHYATVEGHFEIVDYLLRSGIERDLKTTSGLSALDFAARIDNVKIVTLLMSWGVGNRVKAAEIAKNSGSIRSSKVIERYILNREKIFSKKGFFSLDNRLLEALKGFNSSNLMEATFCLSDGVYLNAYGILSLRKIVGFFRKEVKTLRGFCIDHNLEIIANELSRVHAVATSQEGRIPFSRSL